MAANDNDNEQTLRELYEQLDAKLKAPIDPRELPVRYSRLKLIGQSPAHYYASCQRNEAEESLAMRLGSGVHAMILGEPVTRFSGRRAGKVWDAFEREHAGTVILNDREWSEAERMSLAILRHDEASRLLLDGTEREQHLAWDYCGRACSSRPDAFKRGSHIAELKTARSSNPRDFMRDAWRMGYVGQLAFYDDAHQALTGCRFPNAYLIAVEKSSPHPVTVYRLTERAMDLARRTTRLWIETLIGCEAINHWPGYSETTIDLDAPDNDNEPIEIVIDGETAEVA